MKQNRQRNRKTQAGKKWKSETEVKGHKKKRKESKKTAERGEKKELITKLQINFETSQWLSWLESKAITCTQNCESKSLMWSGESVAVMFNGT